MAIAFDDILTLVDPLIQISDQRYSIFHFSRTFYTRLDPFFTILELSKPISDLPCRIFKLPATI